MYPLNDLDLERVSREAAEQFDVESAASGWEQLEQRLDVELPVTRERDRRRFLWLLLLLALISGGSLVWIVGNNNGQKNIASKNIKKSTTDVRPSSEAARVNDADAATTPRSAQQKPGEALSPEPINPASSSSAPSPVTSLPLSPEQETKAGQSKQVVPSKKGGLISETDQPVAQRSDLEKETVGITRKQQLVTSKGSRNKTSNKNNRSLFAPTQVQTDQPETTPFLTENFKPGILPSMDNRYTRMFGPVAAFPRNAPGATAGKPAGSTTADKKDAALAKQAKKNSSSKNVFPRVEIGLTGDIDYSFIKTTHTNKPGYGAGLSLSYNLSPRWSVSSGFIFTRKNYGADGEDYHPPKHYWTNYVDLKGLEGYCEMWDIPLNVRYNLTTKNKLQWFASTGLSTYIMQKQYYKYYYRANNLPDIKDWQNTSQENYLFSVLNLSAGFQKKLNRTTSLQVEPFMKLPLHGIGFGKMDIATYGMLFSVKFAPGKKK